MTSIKINKMLESTGGNYITLERITLDKRAPADIRLTAFLAINKRHKNHTVPAVNQEVASKEEKKKHIIKTDQFKKGNEKSTM
jgi:hypothetical protein